jgi:hypothetical protein
MLQWQCAHMQPCNAARCGASSSECTATKGQARATPCQQAAAAPKTRSQRRRRPELTLLVLDLLLHVLDGVAGLHLERDRLAREGLDEDLHAAAQAQHQVQRRLLLDVVVGQRAAVLQLLAGEDQALLVRRDA